MAEEEKEKDEGTEERKREGKEGDGNTEIEKKC